MTGDETINIFNGLRQSFDEEIQRRCNVASCVGRGRGARAALSQIRLEPFEDLPALEIEDAQADRSRRPGCIGRGADRARGVGGANFGFVENGRAKIGADAKELEPEALRVNGRIRSSSSNGSTSKKRKGVVARRLSAPPATSASSSLRVEGSAPRRSLTRRAMRLATAPQWATASAARACRWRRRASRIGAEPERCDQSVGVSLGRLGALDCECRRARLRGRRHGPTQMRMRSSCANGHLHTLREPASGDHTRSY